MYLKPWLILQYQNLNYRWSVFYFISILHLLMFPSLKINLEPAPGKFTGLQNDTFLSFSLKIGFDNSNKLSPLHDMSNFFFCRKKMKKYFKCCLLTFLSSMLNVNRHAGPRSIVIFKNTRIFHFFSLFFFLLLMQVWDNVKIIEEIPHKND